MFGIHLLFAPDFWQGTGGAIIGSLLSGVVAAIIALASSSYAAARTRRQEFEREARSSAMLIAASAHDTLDEVLNYASADYASRAYTAIQNLSRTHIQQAAVIRDIELLDALNLIVIWLRQEWIPTVEIVRSEPNHRLVDGIHESDLSRMAEVAKVGSEALRDFIVTMVHWQVTKETKPHAPRPDTARMLASLPEPDAMKQD